MLLMVQKSGDHELRLVYFSHYLPQVLASSQVVVWDVFYQQYWSHERKHTRDGPATNCHREWFEIQTDS